MTESDWLTCTDPMPMLKHLCTGENHRKDRLFLVACCRGIWHLLVDPESREAVELAERHADGEASWEELEAAREKLELLADRPDDASWLPALDLVDTATWVWQRLDMGVICCFGRPPRLRGVGHPRGEGLNIEIGGLFAWMAVCPNASDDAARDRAWREQVALVRCVYDDPFRPATHQHAWLPWDGGIVAGLVRAAYEDRLLPSGHRDPARLAVLADALLDAGCDDEGLLEHLRSPGPHVRGCFALDALLGKS